MVKQVAKKRMVESGRFGGDCLSRYLSVLRWTVYSGPKMPNQVFAWCRPDKWGITSGMCGQYVAMRQGQTNRAVSLTYWNKPWRGGPETKIAAWSMEACRHDGGFIAESKGLVAHGRGLPWVVRVNYSSRMILPPLPPASTRRCAAAASANGRQHATGTCSSPAATACASCVNLTES